MRIGALLLSLLIAPAHAQPVPTAGGFDPRLVTNVYATALSFMAPRTLEPVAVSQLTIWGLHGLTALDPDLNTELRDGQLLLTAKGRAKRIDRRGSSDGSCPDSLTGEPIKPDPAGMTTITGQWAQSRKT